MDDDPRLPTDFERALAYRNTFDFMGRLYLDGPGEHLAWFIESIPPLHEALPDEQNKDVLAAAHYRLFGMNVFPYESMFLDPENTLGGMVASTVRDFYQAINFEAGLRHDSTDHIGYELLALGFLCDHQAGALEFGQPDTASFMTYLQAKWMDEHLLCWLPGLVQAIRQQGNRFYTALAELTLESVLARRTDLSDNPVAASLELPDPPDLLDDPQTGLKQIARRLLTTAYSGLYLSRDDIARLARQQQIPRGFGERPVLLTNLLTTAADYDKLPDLLGDLLALLGEWEAMYHVHRAAEAPLAAVAEVWLERLAATRAMLVRVRGAV